MCVLQVVKSVAMLSTLIRRKVRLCFLLEHLYSIWAKVYHRLVILKIKAVRNKQLMFCVHVPYLVRPVVRKQWNVDEKVNGT